MVALTAPRKVRRLEDSSDLRPLQVFGVHDNAASVIFEGAAVVIENSSGYAERAASQTAANYTAVGVARRMENPRDGLVNSGSNIGALVDNNGGTAGSPKLVVEAGTFEFNESTADEFDQGDVGSRAYFTDDNTVTLTAGTNVFAGIVREVYQGRVFVTVDAKNRLLRT